MKQIASDPYVYQIDLTPETVRECVADYQANRPDLGDLFTDRLSPYRIDRVPAGSVFLRCPVCRAELHTRTGELVLVAEFRFRAEKLPGMSAVMTFPVCQACAFCQAPDLAAEVYYPGPARRRMN